MGSCSRNIRLFLFSIMLFIWTARRSKHPSCPVIEIKVLPGTWKVEVQNGGVSAMHMTTTYLDTVVMFDRTDFGPSKLLLDRHRCRNDPNDLVLKHDCWAHSIEYNVANNTIRPLMILSDTWCSSGAFAANGTLVQTGGYNDGDKTIRYFAPCKYSNTNKTLCDWQESKAQKLKDRRWYASNQILPDNRVIVVGGRNAFSYEFVPKKSSREGVYRLPFLQKTYAPFSENNLYPFLHLSSDGNLFIFANKDSILFNYKRNRVVKEFPRMPGGGARNYPSSGSSVMMPLHYTNSFQRVEILICGGAPENAYNKSKSGNFTNALNNCGRIVITDRNPRWSMEEMPKSRVMPDMLILPNGEILIINGAQKGSAGWELAIDPSYSPFLYRPNETLGSRFSVLAPSTIARLYHSTANILRDGRVLVGGSNPHPGYIFSGEKFPTELRLEAYSPYYLDTSYKNLRPVIASVKSSHSSIAYGSNFTVEFLIDCSRVVPGFNNSDEDIRIEFNIYAPPFTTHSFSMNQRMLQLGATGHMIKEEGYVATVMAPPSPVAAPPGYYMLFVVNHGIPSIGEWIKIF